MSVYDDIAARLDAEQAAITSEATVAGTARDAAFDQAETEHRAAVAWAQEVFDKAMLPLTARAQEVEVVRSFIRERTTPADPQTPSATGSATTSAPDEQPAPASEPSEPATPSEEPSTLTEQPEPSPSTESGEPSPDPEPTASPEPITVQNLGGTETIDLNLPVQVPLSTGQVTIVPASDVIAARDASIADDALTTQQLDLRRNSDWP